MGFQYRAECDRCSYTSEFIWPLWACYQWPDGRTREIAQCVIWYNACTVLSIGETITPLEAMEELAALEPMRNITDSRHENTKVHWDQQSINAALAYARYPRYAHLYEHLNCKRWNMSQAVSLRYTLDGQMAWRRARMSSAHCLTCGSLDFSDVGLDDKEEPRSIMHPDCGGLISIMKMQKVRRKSGPALWTTEGERLAVMKT